MDKEGNITNNQRIVGALPTIKYAAEHGAKAIILMSHLGRPDGKAQAKFSMKPVVPELEKQLGKKVSFANDSVGKEVEDTVNSVTDGGIVLLENLRFHAEEEGSSKDEQGNKVKADKAKVEEFRKGLTALGDVYISTPPEMQTNQSIAKEQPMQMTPSAPPTADTAAWSAYTSPKEPPASS